MSASDSENLLEDSPLEQESPKSQLIKEQKEQIGTLLHTVQSSDDNRQELQERLDDSLRNVENANEDIADLRHHAEQHERYKVDVEIGHHRQLQYVSRLFGSETSGRQPASTADDDPRTDSCWVCGELGHISYGCPHRKGGPIAAPPRTVVPKGVVNGHTGDTELDKMSMYKLRLHIKELERAQETARVDSDEAALINATRAISQAIMALNMLWNHDSYQAGGNEDLDDSRGDMENNRPSSTEISQDISTGSHDGPSRPKRSTMDQAMTAAPTEPQDQIGLNAIPTDTDTAVARMFAAATGAGHDPEIMTEFEIPTGNPQFPNRDTALQIGSGLTSEEEARAVALIASLASGGPIPPSAQPSKRPLPSSTESVQFVQPAAPRYQRTLDTIAISDDLAALGYGSQYPRDPSHIPHLRFRITERILAHDVLLQQSRDWTCPLNIRGNEDLTEDERIQFQEWDLLEEHMNRNARQQMELVALVNCIETGSLAPRLGMNPQNQEVHGACRRQAHKIQATHVSGIQPLTTTDQSPPEFREGPPGASQVLQDFCDEYRHRPPTTVAEAHRRAAHIATRMMTPQHPITEHTPIEGIGYQYPLITPSVMRLLEGPPSQEDQDNTLRGAATSAATRQMADWVAKGLAAQPTNTGTHPTVTAGLAGHMAPQTMGDRGVISPNPTPHDPPHTYMKRWGHPAPQYRDEAVPLAPISPNMGNRHQDLQPQTRLGTTEEELNRENIPPEDQRSQTAPEPPPSPTSSNASQSGGRGRGTRGQRGGRSQGPQLAPHVGPMTEQQRLQRIRVQGCIGYHLRAPNQFRGKQTASIEIWMGALEDHMLANRLTSDVDRCRCLIKYLGDKVGTELLRAILPRDHENWAVCRDFMLSQYSRNDSSERRVDREKFKNRDQRQHETQDEYMDALRLLRIQGYPNDSTSLEVGGQISQRDRELMTRFVNGQYYKRMKEHLEMYYVVPALLNNRSLYDLVEYSVDMLPRLPPVATTTSVRAADTVSEASVRQVEGRPRSTEAPNREPSAGLTQATTKPFVPPRLVGIRFPATDVATMSADGRTGVMAIGTAHPAGRNKSSGFCPKVTGPPLTTSQTRKAPPGKPCDRIINGLPCGATAHCSQRCEQIADPRQRYHGHCPEEGRTLASRQQLSPGTADACCVCDQLIYVAADCTIRHGPMPNPAGSDWRTHWRCQRCGQLGHFARLCTTPLGELIRAPDVDATWSRDPSSRQFPRFYADGTPYQNQVQTQAEEDALSIAIARRSNHSSYGQYSDDVCGRCGDANHHEQYCLVPLSYPSDEPEVVHRNMKCDRCGRYGHLTRCCEAEEPRGWGHIDPTRFVDLHPAHRDYANRVVGTDCAPNLKCQRCGRHNHVTRDCRATRESLSYLKLTRPGTIRPSPRGQESQFYRASLADVPDARLTGRRTMEQAHMDSLTNRDAPHTVCNRCLRIGHTERFCQVTAEGIRERHEDGVFDLMEGRMERHRCHRCKQFGHLSSDCQIPTGILETVRQQVIATAVRQVEVATGTDPMPTPQEALRKCLVCDKLGHDTIDCPEVPPHSQRELKRRLADMPQGPQKDTRNWRPTRPPGSTQLPVRGRFTTGDLKVDAMNTSQLRRHIVNLTDEIEQFCSANPDTASDHHPLAEMLRRRSICINSIIAVPHDDITEEAQGGNMTNPNIASNGHGTSN
jgi:hypothetical protein